MAARSRGFGQLGSFVYTSEGKDSPMPGWRLHMIKSMVRRTSDCDLHTSEVGTYRDDV